MFPKATLESAKNVKSLTCSLLQVGGKNWAGESLAELQAEERGKRSSLFCSLAAVTTAPPDIAASISPGLCVVTW